MRRLPPLGSLRAFEAAARHSSFKQAAEELGVTPTAISHQVRLLEDNLGRRLFERRTRQVILTEAGRQLYPALRDGLDAMHDGVDRVRRQGESPTAVITTTAAFAAHWLVPRLSVFSERHPSIAIAVLATDEVVSLEGGKADLAVRLAGRPPAEHGAIALFDDHFTPVASPTLNISRLADLEKVPLIHFDWHRPRPDAPDWPKWLAAAGHEHREAMAAFRFNEESHALQAAIAGQGVALFSLTIASEPLRRGLLVRPFATTIPGQTYYLLRRPTRQAGAAVEAVSQWLLRQAAADADLPGSRPSFPDGEEGKDRGARATAEKG
ncbi:LysR substrate-binding domain-containing protein [Sphingosinicella sp. CPCC 101087]|uniref:LysR substrate-binding domain-containing protein n=1 Tax=Sphingosinicella sp. CPCC 101087 TaxID=2497754 RepID=UPI00101D15DD|nr:LysR substrate-binding domain-containing protein [Sphingosinicella sp. CPCC 101087]